MARVPIVSNGIIIGYANTTKVQSQGVTIAQPVTSVESPGQYVERVSAVTAGPASDTGGGNSSAGNNNAPAQSYSAPAQFNNSNPRTTTSSERIVKTPDRFLTVFRPDTTASTLEKLLFENIGGIEIANIERHDTIDGKNPYYSIISNLSSIKERLDPITLIARQRAGLRPGDFGKQIDLFTKIPLDNYLRGINLIDYIFIDTDDNSETYGSLIIELVDINDDEFIEVEIASNGTIYEIEEQ